MEKVRLHVKLTSRVTTITVHRTLYDLLSLKLTGELNQRKTIVNWLSKRLVEVMGDVPKRRKFEKMSYSIAHYAADIIISEIADSELISQYEHLRYAENHEQLDN